MLVKKMLTPEEIFAWAAEEHARAVKYAEQLMGVATNDAAHQAMIIDFQKSQHALLSVMWQSAAMGDARQAAAEAAFVKAQGYASYREMKAERNKAETTPTNYLIDEQELPGMEQVTPEPEYVPEPDVPGDPEAWAVSSADLLASGWYIVPEATQPGEMPVFAREVEGEPHNPNAQFVSFFEAANIYRAEKRAAEQAA